MNEFSPRMKQILQVLLEQNKEISVKNLAEQVGVSKRTVQRELGYVDRSLKKYGVSFHSRTGVGVWLTGDDGARAELAAALTESGDYDAGNREERRRRLILEILKEKGLKKLFYYSSQFGVSEATVSADLAEAEKWLKRYGLRVSRKPGSGVSVEGTEENYRRAIRAFISENIDTRTMKEAYEGGIARSYDILGRESISRILNQDIVRRVIDCIMRVDDPQIQTLTENSYMGLVIHISIAVNRIMKNEVIDEEEPPQKEKKDGAYRLAEAIVSELEKEFEIEIPKVELSYICLHIRGSKHEKVEWDAAAGRTIDSQEIRQTVNRMIDAFGGENAYLLKQDDEFIQGLLAHLQPTLVRLLGGMQIRNPVLDEIKTNYADIYERCLSVSKVLEDFTGKKVPEEETGFLTVHFGAALVRLEGRNEQIRKVHIGVVCSSGIGISRLMATKLKHVFQGRISIATYGKNDVTPFVAGKTDFFVSSISLENVDTPVVYVNPLLNEKDMEQIRAMIFQYERTPEVSGEAEGFSRELEEINIMAAQINAVIKYMEFFKVDNYITFDELLIAVGEKLSPYRDQGEMIQEDIRRREKISSQIFAEFGFALLHTRTKGVVRPSFTVCMTKDLKPFLDPYFRNIQVVFIMLLPADSNVKTNSAILGYISTVLIEDPAFMDTVLTGNRENIRRALSAHLKKFFNTYLSKI
ncbi:MAG TPA: BglG family transcription antiterminator [Candidatus Blautia excrementigallinarum]|nr:BglG family transcription antiterminator [Candidatus Blautia excrementigallinarum]